MGTIYSIDLWQAGFSDLETELRGAVADGYKTAKEVFDGIMRYHKIDIIKNAAVTSGNPELTDFSNAVLFKAKDDRPTRLALFRKEQDFDERVRAVLDEKLLFDNQVSWNDVGRSTVTTVDAKQDAGKDFLNPYNVCSADRTDLLQDFVANATKLTFFRQPMNIVGNIGEHDLYIRQSRHMKLECGAEKRLIQLQDFGCLGANSVQKVMKTAKDRGCEVVN